MSAEVSNVGEDMVRFPDMIIAIGGAGKRLVKDMLKKEWFVRKIIQLFELGQRSGGGYRGTIIRIIDSDKTMIAQDRKEIEEIRSLINKIGRDIGGDRDYAKDVFDLDNDCIVDISCESANELLDPNFVRDVKRRIDVRVWWISDDENGISELASKIDRDFLSASFVNGVNRRRFLSKALIYHYLTKEKEESNPLVMMRAGRYVAIVTSLGGGTGSGTFLDVAKYLKKKMPNCSIILFAVLPTDLEPENECCNAYSALSELEKFVEIKKEFDLIVLMPIDHSGYRGGDVKDSSYYGLIEFSENFPYIFTAVCERFFSHDPKMGEVQIKPHPYKKFVIACSYIVRYAAEYAIKKEERIKEAISTFIEYCDKEEGLRKRIDELLNEVGIKSDDKSKISEEIKERLDEFKKLFCEGGEYYDLLLSADFNVIKKFSEVVKDKLKESEQRSLVDIYKEIIEDTENEYSPLGDEKKLLETMRKYIKNIKELGKQISADDPHVFDMKIREAFRSIVKCTPLRGRLIVHLENQAEEIPSKMKEIENEINRKNKEKKELTLKKSVLEIIQKMRDFLEKCKEKKDELIREGRRMDDKDWKEGIGLEEFKNELRKKIEQILNESSEFRNKIERIMREFEHASEYYRLKASEEFYKRKPFWNIIARKAVKEAKRRIDNIIGSLNALSFDPEKGIKISEGALDYIPKARDLDIKGEEIEKLDKEIKALNKKIENLNGEIKELDEEKKYKEKKLKLIRGIYDLKENSREVYNLRDRYNSIFREILEEKGGVKEEGKFVHSLYPEDLRVKSKITEDDDLTILSKENSDDLKRVKEKITELFRKYVTPEMLAESTFVGIKGKLIANNREIGIDAMRVITLSLDKNIELSLNAGIKGKLRGMYGVEDGEIMGSHIKLAAKWDIAVVTLFMYLPIEMLRNIRRYFDKYNSLYEKEGERGLLRHHSVGLEDGYFYIRERLFKDSEVIEMRDRDIEEIKGKIDEIYKRIEIKELAERLADAGVGR